MTIRQEFRTMLSLHKYGLKNHLVVILERLLYQILLELCLHVSFLFTSAETIILSNAFNGKFKGRVSSGLFNDENT